MKTAAGLMALIGLLLSLPAAAEEPQPSKKPTAFDVAGDFVQALSGADIDKLLSLSGDSFDFDGDPAVNRNQQKESWRRFFERNRDALDTLQNGEIKLIDYLEAQKRFGPAPRKFAHLRPARCKFAVVTYKNRNGLLLILSKTKQGNWQVVAATD